MARQADNGTHTQKSLDFGDRDKPTGPVECLGQTFENDEARRAHYLKLLAEKLKDPEFRKTPGFPHGTDEDILRLSDPPYYTACPNPFLETILFNPRGGEKEREFQTEPLAVDVSEGKHDPVYKAHTYHTKGPPKAILRFLEHYTQEGDVVLDPFCGSGMTGIAGSMLPERTVVLSELSPAAAHIAGGYNRPWNTQQFEEDALRILDKARTQHIDAFSVFENGKRTGDVKYWVWTDVLTCESCSQSYLFSDAAVDLEEKRIDATYPCPHCSAEQSKINASYARTTLYDPMLGRSVSQNLREPFWVVYENGGTRVKRALTTDEVQAGLTPPDRPRIQHFPVVEFMNRSGVWGCLHRTGYHHGITHAHHFYTWRVLEALDTIWGLIGQAPSGVQHHLRFWFLATAVKCSKLMNYNADGIGRVMKGSLYVSSLTQEVSPFHFLSITLRDMVSALSVLENNNRKVFVSTSAAQHLPLPANSVDYIFVDPPFGKNLIYSELNYLWECWLRLATDETSETIVNQQFGKTLATYTDGMAGGFAEMYRVLRSGRWVTVEFHNSKNSVWLALQQAMERAGFVIADVRILDKKHGSIKQVQTAGAVKQDLVISAYKPSSQPDTSVEITRGSEEAVWAFVRDHLLHLPSFGSEDEIPELLVERIKHRLYDRMVAFHVQRRISIPMDAGAFYAGLQQRFPERDGMFFLADQLASYDKVRSRVAEVKQLDLFVVDELSAINWLRQKLQNKPMSFQELHPIFTREVNSWAKHEKTIELKEILALNFLCYDGNGRVPSQIHSYLSTNFKDLRNLDKDDPALKAKARDRWYVPDPSKEADLEKLRLRTLLREFEDYRTATSRKLKQFRTEAVRAGFKHCYDNQDYQTIVDVAAKLQDQVIQEDEKLLMYVDVAAMRLGGDL